jgi:hypothetical protein
MFEIIEKNINVDLPLGHHLHCMMSQIPNHLGFSDFSCRLADPQQKWQQIKSIFELIAKGEGNLKKCHFLALPEAALSGEHVDAALTFISERFRPNTVTFLGIDHVPLLKYREFLERYPDDNSEALASVIEDLNSGDIEEIPTNWSITAVKENDGRLRVFMQAKSHPFVGEEHLDSHHDLYRGKVFPLFRCQPNCFNFMSLICFDYVYRDLYQSNISAIIDKANQLFFNSRQRLDLLMVLECNPKPEHQAFRDVVNGFYGEYLAYTPGVKDTITGFCNTSAETSGLPKKETLSFGYSSVAIHKSHKLSPADNSEYEVDDFGGLPICRLRFGTATRLYYFNLPMFHELDPRTTRVPMKIHGIFEQTADGWRLLED